MLKSAKKIDEFAAANDLPIGMKGKSYDWVAGPVTVIGVNADKVICETEGLGIVGFEPAKLKPFIV
ncbi:MAG: hypothetical protein V3S55_15350 [Nitrospiraceae bacterium]